MSKVFVNIGLSLDGYMAPEGMTMQNPGYKNWGAKWGALMSWLVNQQYFRENLKFGPGGETGPVNDLVRSTTERIGANIMGKRMFDQGEIVESGSFEALVAKGGRFAALAAFWVCATMRLMESSRV